MLIRELHQRGIRLALGSSATRKNIEAVLKFFRFRNYFDVVVSGCEVERSKPFPDIYIEAAKQLETDPSECIVIEDSSNGIRAAKLAGMKSVAYRNLNSGEQDLSLANHVIDSFDELDPEKLVNLFKE